jgi:hypothetical protein
MSEITLDEAKAKLKIWMDDLPQKSGHEKIRN